MNKLILEGKEYTLSDELVGLLKREVEVQEKKENPFEKILGNKYYYMSGNGKIFSETDCKSDLDEKLYATGNYCHDVKILNQRLLYETLNRLLWRYSIAHDGEIKTYGINTLYHIEYKIPDHTFLVSWSNPRITEGVIYFKREETAQKAIEEVIKPFLEEHPDFNYFRW